MKKLWHIVLIVGLLLIPAGCRKKLPPVEIPEVEASASEETLPMAEGDKPAEEEGEKTSAEGPRARRDEAFLFLTRHTPVYPSDFSIGALDSGMETSTAQVYSLIDQFLGKWLRGEEYSGETGPNTRRIGQMLSYVEDQELAIEGYRIGHIDSEKMSSGMVRVNLRFTGRAEGGQSTWADGEVWAEYRGDKWIISDLFAGWDALSELSDEETVKFEPNSYQYLDFF